MSKIMDRLIDLQAVNWAAMPPSTLSRWEYEALQHVKECRCEKCALFFARLPDDAFRHVTACAINTEIIITLREILRCTGKL